MMQSRRNVLVFAAVVLFVLALGGLLRPQIVQRATPDNNVIFTADYHLSGVHDDDLVVMGDSIALDAGSRVSGDTSLVGQTLGVAGLVEGDLTMLGEDLFLLQSAEIDGDANLTGKSVTIDGVITGDLLVNSQSLTILPGAQIAGDLNFCGAEIRDRRVNAVAPGCATPIIDPFAELIALRNSALGGNALTMQFAPVGILVLAVFGTLALMGSSVLAVTFFPRQVSHIEEAMRARPRGFGGVGLATYALIIGLFFALTFLLALFPPLGFVFIPVFLIVGLILLILSLSGLITLAVMLGDWLLSRSARSADGVRLPPLIAAVVGSLALSVGVVVISLLPFGFVISFVLLGVISSVGLGASLFTRVGTRPVGRTYFVQG